MSKREATRFGVALLVAIGFAGASCGGRDRDTEPQADCEAIERQEAALASGAAEAWRDLGESLPGRAADAAAVADALEPRPPAGTPAASSFELAEGLLAARAGPLNRLQGDVRAGCGIDLGDPFAVG